MNDAPKLLVVDDEQVVCKSCTRIFETEGYAVETCTNATDGLRRATEENFAAILLDIRIPGMDGLEFLDRLRKQNAKVPVIVMTGYSSIQSAAAAMRLSAADYIPKPFTPDEIAGAVRRIVPKKQHVVIQAATRETASTSAQPWQAASDEVRFLDESWRQRGTDGTLRAGAFISKDESDGVASLTLPKVGDRVYRGLPMAALVGPGATYRLLPAPVSGEVLEVNRRLAESPAAVWDDPCHAGWIARIKPTAADEDEQATSPRALLLASADEVRAASQRALFAGMGCAVTIVRESHDVVARLKELDARVLVLDAASFSDRGPQLVHRIREVLPAVKVVVIGEPTGSREAQFREERIHYYAVEPLAGKELIEVLRTVYKPTAKAAPTPVSSAIPLWICRVRITNRQGRKVSLMATRGVIRERDGLGQQLVRAILDAGFPVTIGLGNDPLSAMHLRQEAEDADQIILLTARDMARLPGSLARDLPNELSESAGDAVKAKLVTLAIEPPATEGRQLAFDARTTEALAHHIVREMTATPA